MEIYLERSNNGGAFSQVPRALYALAAALNEILLYTLSHGGCIFIAWSPQSVETLHW